MCGSNDTGKSWKVERWVTRYAHRSRSTELAYAIGGGTHVIAHHVDEEFDIKLNHYTRSKSEYYVLEKLR